MVKKIAKIMILCILTACMDFGSVVMAKDVTYGGEQAFTEKKVVNYTENSVIMRLDNNNGYVNNYSKDLDDIYDEIRPYISHDVIYVPIEFTVKGCGFITERTDDTVVLHIGNKDYAAKEGDTLLENSQYPVEISKHRLFAYVGDLSEIMGKTLFNDGDLVILSSDKNIVNDKADNSVISTITRTLDFEWGRVFLGCEGFVTGIITHPKNPEIMYSRTDVGGCYKWNAESETWTQLLDCIPSSEWNLTGVQGLAIDPNDTNTLYAACGQYSYKSPYDVLKSTDQGRTWKRTNLNKLFCSNAGTCRYSGECIAVDPNNSNVVVCGTYQDGLWISTDGAESWSKITSVPVGATIGGGVTVVLFDENSEVVNGRTSVIYAGVFGSGIYKSTNGGQSFTKIEGSPEVTLRMQVCDGVLYAASDNRNIKTAMAGLFAYDGEKWDNITPPFTQDTKSVCGFLFDYTNHDFLLAAGAPYGNNLGRAFCSYDRGKTWRYVSNSGGVGPCCLIQDRNNPKRVFFAHGRGIWAYENIYADSYTIGRADYGMEELCCDKVVSMPSKESPLCLVGCMDRGFEYADRLDTLAIGQADFGPHYGQAIEMDFCEEDPSLVVRLGKNDDNNGRVLLSNDYGRRITSGNWLKGKNVLGCAVSAVKQDNGYPVIIVAQPADNDGKGALWRSKDWGQTWEILKGVPVSLGNGKYTGLSWVVLRSDRVDENTFYYCDEGLYSTGEGFYVSKDGGDTWKKSCTFSTSLTEGYFQTVPGVEGMVWYKADSDILVSKDKGGTWEKMDNVNGAVSFGFGKGKSGTNIPAAYMIGTIKDDFGVYMSDDLGRNWRKINDSLNNIPGIITQVTGDRKVYGRVLICTSGLGLIYGQAIDVDDHPPIITLENKSTSDEYGMQYAIDDENLTINGSTNERAGVRINNQPVECTTDCKFEYSARLQEGENIYRVEAVDKAGNKASPVYLKVRYIPHFFEISFDTEKEILTNKNVITITGETSSPATVYAGDNYANTDENNRFSVTYALHENENDINVYAKADNGSVSETTTLRITMDITPPEIELMELPTDVDTGNCIIKGKLNEAGQVRVNNRNVAVRENLTFYAYCTLDEAKNTVKIQAMDTAGNVNKPACYTINRNMLNPVDKSKVKVNYKSDDFKYDGDVNEWKFDNRLEKLLDGSPNNLVEFGTMWDENYLYIGVKVFDDVIYTDNSTNFTNDCIEVYIDGNNHKGTKYDAYDHQYIFIAGETDENHISKVTDDGYTMEIRIPWADRNINAKDGVEIGIDMDCGDNDNVDVSHSRTGVIGFYGTMDDWSNPSVFSTFTLKR